MDFHDELLLNTKDGFDGKYPQIPEKIHWSFFISPNTTCLFKIQQEQGQGFNSLASHVFPDMTCNLMLNLNLQ